MAVKVMCILVALVLIVTNKEARKRVTSDHLHPCGVGLPITGCHGEWNLGPPFWTHIQAAVSRRALHGICKEGNLKGVVLWKVMAVVVWGKKGFVGTCDSSEQWTFASYTRTLNSECLPSLSSPPEEKCWRCSFSMTVPGTHKHATTENITKVAYTVFSHSLYYPYLMHWNVHLLGPFKDCLLGHHYMDDESLQNSCASGCREKGATLLSSSSSACSCSKVEGDKDGDLKSNHVLGSTVVKFLKYSCAWVLNSMKWRMEVFYFPTAHLYSKPVYELNNSISIFFHNLFVVLYDNAVLHTEFIDIFNSINGHY
jgi:hypothetical protein